MTVCNWPNCVIHKRQSSTSKHYNIQVSQPRSKSWVSSSHCTSINSPFFSC